MNSCKDTDESTKPAEGAPVASEKIDMVKVEGSGFSIGKYEITQSQWYAVSKNSDLYYGIRTEGTKHSYKDTAKIIKTEKIMMNGIEIEVETVNYIKTDSIKKKDSTVYYPDSKMRMNPGMLWVDRLKKQEMEGKGIDQLASLVKGDNLPMVDVSWIDAVRFCNALSKKEKKSKCYDIFFHHKMDSTIKKQKDKDVKVIENGKKIIVEKEEKSDTFNVINSFKDDKNEVVFVIKRDTFDIIDSIIPIPTGKGYRLPTEKEWRLAAQGGNNKYTYAGSNNIDLVAWYSNNSGGRMQAVGAKQPNDLSIYDMSGNVYEWCNDKAKGSNDEYIILGGCWAHGPVKSKIVIDKEEDKEIRKKDFWNYTLGFRVVLSE